LLVYLLLRRNRVVTKDDMIASIWNGRIVFGIDDNKSSQCGPRSPE
jgi:DNA-binding winged helix-turn-helix (wHTH) protein